MRGAFFIEHRCGWERNGANRQKKEFLETAAAAIPKLVDLWKSGPRVKRHTKAECLLPRSPTVRFRALAIFGAGVFFLATLFKVRTFSAVQPRRLVVFFAIKYNSNCDDGEFVAVKFNEEKFQKMTGIAPVDKSRACLEKENCRKRVLRQA